MSRTKENSVIGLIPTMALAVALSVVGSGSAEAGGSVNTGYFGGVAIMGYETVAYFAEARAVKASTRSAGSAGAALAIGSGSCISTAIDRSPSRGPACRATMDSFWRCWPSLA